MSQEACCTCAQLLSSQDSISDLSTEKSQPSNPPHRLPCCQRAVCAACVLKNPRFSSYCPFCQVTSEPSPLPQGLRDPPPYTSRPSSPKKRHRKMDSDGPPAYDTVVRSRDGASGEDGQTSDVTHYLRESDTISSISLAYQVPRDVLRKHNSVFDDNLLHARKTMSIPQSHYQGPSLSAEPVESEEETERKNKIRRFMVSTKCHEYSVAELYLKQSEGDLDDAVESWLEDEKWERENPMKKGENSSKGRKFRGFGAGLTGQL